MKIKYKSLPNMDIAIMELHGNLIGDTENDKLAKMIRHAFDQGNRKLILDMGRVSYINDTGLDILIQIHTHCSNRDGRLKLCRVGVHMNNNFILTKLVRMFDIEATQEKAIYSLIINT